MTFRTAASLGLTVFILVLTGVAGNWAVSGAWNKIREDQPALDLRAVEGGLGHGLTLGLLGGFRSVTADFLWLANNLAWERQDLSETTRLIELTTAVDPQPLYFWINGSRMIAYDMPVWRQDAAGASGRTTVAAQIDQEQADQALQYLNTARRFHPKSPALLVEMANIRLNRLHDIGGAAELYRDAALLPDAPRYAARIYGELLKRQGRLHEALEWLKQVYATLNPGRPEDLADVVLDRIRTLEQQLQVPEKERFRPDSK